MTICIAAICENGQRVVVAADRMFTAGPPLNLEFEPPLSKIERMASTCVALAAGNSLYASEILGRARSKLDSGQQSDVLRTSSLVKETYIEFRNEKIEEQLILPALGQDFVTFRSRGGFLPNYFRSKACCIRTLWSK